MPIGSEEADQLLFGPASTDADARAACRADHPEPERVACLLGARYRGDARAAKVAIDLHARAGVIAGVDSDHIMDGGYRGLLHLLPALPTGAERRHLEWVAEAFAEYDAFFGDAGMRAGARFRWRDLAVRFFRSERVRTPSAYAHGWGIGYNLAGSLNVSGAMVRETLFHELFHLNDELHGDWSPRALDPIRASILAKCGASTPCLAPYAPSGTIVRGSTYYAFHPKVTVIEYAAEVALRYFREQRAAMRGEHLGERPFKCGPPENARAWALVAQEFFGGVDRVPACK
jgi:hypothetical protein